MKNLPMITVVMPVYNVAQYVASAIRSVLRQSYGDFRLYIVDGGSTDGSREIVESFDDPRMELVELPNNGSISQWVCDARNEVVKYADSKYIAMMDADDVNLPDRFFQQVSLLEDNPQLLAVTVGFHFFTDSRRIEWLRHSHQLHMSDLNDNKFHLPEGHLGTLMVRSEIFRELNGYDRIFPLGEDFELWSRIAERGPVGFLDVPAYLYRLNRHSITCNVQVRGDVIRRLTLRLSQSRLKNDHESQDRILDEIRDLPRAPWYYSRYITGIRNAKIELINRKVDAVFWILFSLLFYPKRFSAIVKMVKSTAAGKGKQDSKVKAWLEAVL